MIYSQHNLRFHILFVFTLILHILSLFFNINEISIHYKEALGFFYSDEFIYRLARVSYETLGHNDFALRAPFVFVHICNILLLYAICLNYFKRASDGYLCVLVYMLLPGIVFSSILISKTNIIIFLALICIYWQKRFSRNPYFTPAFSVFLDPSFSILYLGMFFYALRNKDTAYLFFTLLCFGINMSFFGIDVSGHPQSHFIDTLGGLMFLFSPLLLVYYIYTLIASVRKHNEFMSYISLSALVFVTILSLRQKVDLQTLVPLSVIALPVVIKHFLSDIRIRLKMFAKPYVMRLNLILLFMFLQSLGLYFNKFFYLFSTQSHFAHSYYYGKEIANALKSKGIESIQAEDKKLELQLRFYGIDSTANTILRKTQDTQQSDISVEYLWKIIARYKITPIAPTQTTIKPAKKQKIFIKKKQ